MYLSLISLFTFLPSLSFCSFWHFTSILNTPLLLFSATMSPSFINSWIIHVMFIYTVVIIAYKCTASFLSTSR